MEITRIVAKVGKGKNSSEVYFIVDSGAVYSLLPEEIWKKLKLKPVSEMKFSLADGTIIKRKVSEARIEYKGIGRTSPVLLGEKNDDALLGAVTLETMGLMLNPFSRELLPMKMLLAPLRFV
ncbi:MAG: clan AA aspartic protease [Bacteroidetes bacterium]|nr:clan AA aspartic protease [Bacteroidota bacterium]